MAAALAVVPGCSRQSSEPGEAATARFDETGEHAEIAIRLPLDGTLFPQEMPPPLFRWADDSEADAWLIRFSSEDGAAEERFEVGRTQWQPPADRWERIKQRSRERDATVTILGYRSSEPGSVLSAGRISFRTSADKVGAPLFYREVNLPFIDAVADPSKIRWRFGPISSTEPPPVVLENLPVCGNCHSFSANGSVLGMDVDYANDKGSYALVDVGHNMLLADENIITWNDYRREDGQLTFGLLSQVSPDGRHAISTVKDRSVFVPKPELAFSQLFFPIQGILAVYDRQAKTFAALPGADDPAYVQSNPTWSPDGQYIVFARSEVHTLENDTGQALLTKEQCAEFLEEGRPFRFDLYRVPFNGGEGGEPEPLRGASHNGMSNFFAKYSPDGKWIVFCRAADYMLLQPDSELYIIPAAGGEARRLACNTGRMNSWHSWSPNGKWLVFSSKANSDYTQLYLTHIDGEGNSTPPVLLSHLTAADRAANIPEFVSAAPDAIAKITPRFLDDVSFVRAGDSFLRAGNDVEAAIGQYRKALALNPDNAVAHSNLGGVLVNSGAVEEGVRHLQAAIRLDPTEGSPYYNLGMLRARQGRVDEAIENLTLAVKYRPEVADAHRVLGAELCNKDRRVEGVLHLAEAVRLNPKDAVAHYLLGKAKVADGVLDQALEELAAAVKLEADYVPALRLLSQLEFQTGHFAESIRHLSRAVEVQSDDPRMLGDLAWMLCAVPEQKLRDPSSAVAYAERACEITDRRVFELLDVLGASYAATGRFEQAIETAGEALELAHASSQSYAAARIAERIELYWQGKTFTPPLPAPAGP